MKKFFIVMMICVLALSLVTLTSCNLSGEKGEAGVGIKSIEKTRTEGLVDTYTITMTDGATSTFTVTNGNSGSSSVAGSTYTPDEYFRFTLLEDDTYEVSARWNDMPICVVIPSTYNGKVVSRVAESGFCIEKDTLFTTEEYVLSEGITAIEDGAFAYHHYLTKITLPKSLSYMGSFVFADSNLKQIVYKGTIAEWNAISKDERWDYGFGLNVGISFTIHCTDGDIEWAIKDFVK